MYLFIVISSIDKYLYVTKEYKNLSISKFINQAKFSGQWYEIAKNPIFLLGNTRCNKINININRSSYSMTTSYIQT